ncbi:MAG: aminopeptidase P family protein [Clostridia bacterium]|nr:aminopeptidase P family protein [Clostridia bacterium]
MIQKLQKSLPRSCDGILITSEENRRYFTGFHASNGMLIVTHNNALFLTDSRYIEAAQNKITACPVMEMKKIKEQMTDIFKATGLHKKLLPKLLVESDKLKVSDLKYFRQLFKPAVLSTVGGDKIINSLREIKSQQELDCIINAQRIAEKAFDNVLNFIRPGVSEKDIALELDFYMLRNGAEALSFETIAVSGKKSSMPHGVPDGKLIKKGDFITMDFGAVVDGYHSDMTRTVCVGEPSDKQREIYNIVLSAQANALKTIKAGITAKEADSAARDIIKNAGYGEFYRHATGHGVGIEIHEGPVVAGNPKIVLREGNVVTVEPGIYIPDEFGVRIEDVVYVTADGCINLTDSPKNLIIC